MTGEGGGFQQRFIIYIQKYHNFRICLPKKSTTFFSISLSLSFSLSLSLSLSVSLCLSLRLCLCLCLSFSLSHLPRPIRRMRPAYPKKSLNPFLQPKKSICFFSRPQKILASLIDSKKHFWPKFQTQKNHLDPSVIKIC